MNDHPTLTKKDIDRAIQALEELNSSEDYFYVPIDPVLWNGYWYIRKRLGLVGKLFRIIGRRLHSPCLYMIGREVFWAAGLKEFVKMEEE